MKRERARYGDYPALFWDLEPDHSIDTTDAVVLARILTEGSLDEIAALVSLELLAGKLDELVIPEYTRAFWRRVLLIDREAAA